MGTNYYLVKNRPSIDSGLHIGKSSIGWRFLFPQAADLGNGQAVKHILTMAGLSERNNGGGYTRHYE